MLSIPDQLEPTIEMILEKARINKKVKEHVQELNIRREILKEVKHKLEFTRDIEISIGELIERMGFYEMP
jgi:hypothetical protein